jgi:hypothetical protein
MRRPVPAAIIAAFLALALSPALFAEEQAVVEIAVRTVVPATLPPAWDVLLRSTTALDQPAIPYPAKPGEPLRLQLAPGSKWEVSANLPGFWVPRKSLTVGKAGETSRLQLDFWPLGTISGRVQVRQKEIAPPKAVIVKTVAAPAVFNRPAMPPGVLTCPVDKEGRWNCSLPAATFDLVVTAEGFTPHYRWAIAVPPAKSLDLGSFQFERGGSVAAWVAVEGGKIDPAQAKGRLSFVSACDTDAAAMLKMEGFAVERPVSKDGFLQFTGLAPGSYSLEVRQPGLAPARVAGVIVTPQAETFLPTPLLLTRPIALDFEIVPPLDERGEPWRAQATRRAEASQPDPIVFDGRAAEDGRFTVPEQSPGWFRVAVLDSRGNRVHSEPERQLDASQLHRIELHRIAVEGQLRLGSRPLAATLWFGGQYGEKRVRMEADEDGRFTGLLPSQEAWMVDVDAAEPRIQLRTRTEVQPDSSGKAKVEIDLPDTRVFGRVLDANGKPASGAAVVVTALGTDQRVDADPTGAFEVRGLPEGPLGLIASDGGAGVSERAVVNTAGRGTVGPVELRLRAVHRLSGTVVSPYGPVAGAHIVALANAPAVGGGQASTGPGGTFSLELPSNVIALTAVVKAPGFGTQAFPIAVDDKPVSLRVSHSLGDIAIAMPRTAAEFQKENLRVALFQNGIEVPLTALREDVSTSDPSAPNGTPILRLANLAPGSYSACIAQKQVDSKGSLEHNPGAAIACDSGELGAWASLRLSLSRAAEDD